MFYLFYNLIFNVLSVERLLKINCFIIIIFYYRFNLFANTDLFMMMIWCHLMSTYIYILFWYSDFITVLDDTPSGVWYWCSITCHLWMDLWRGCIGWWFLLTMRLRLRLFSEVIMSSSGRVMCGCHGVVVWLT